MATATPEEPPVAEVPQLTPEPVSEEPPEDPELDDVDPPEPEAGEPIASTETSEPPAEPQRPPVADLNALRAALGKNKPKPPANPAVGGSPFAQPPQKQSHNNDLPASQSFDSAMFQDDFSDGKIRNFDDIFEKFPVGDGNYFIYVERKSPQSHHGRKISGIQKPIEYSMGFEEFAKAYGSGVYALTVYGPAPGRKLDREGNPKKKAFTKPIKVEVPDPFKNNPPNLEMAELTEDEEEDMAVYSMRRGGATDADAEIRKAELETDLEKEEKRRLWEERQRERQERKEREAREATIQEASSQTRILETVLNNQSQELRDMRNREPSEVSQMSAMAEILKAVKPEGPSESEINRLQTALTEAERRHAEEITRLREEHRREVDRIREDNRNQERDYRDRTDRDMRDREDNLRRQLEDVRNEAARRQSELREQYEARMADERRQHDRDLKQAREMNNTTNEAGRSAFEMRLEVKQQEINRLTQETARLTHELEMEKSKTLADRVDEFAGAAEALGYQKDEGSKDWKEMLGEAAVGLVQQAPALAMNVATSLKGGPQPGQMPMLPQAAPNAMAQVPMQNYGPVFATEGVDVDLGNMATGSPTGGVVYPDQDPYADFGPNGINPPSEEVVEEEPMQQGSTPIQPEQPVPGAPPTRDPQQPQAFSQQEQQEALDQAQENVDPNGNMQIPDDQIIEFSDMFRQALQQGASPQQFSEEIVAKLGPMMSGAIVTELPLQRVTNVLQNAPNGQKDPLVRREGQKFLKEVWALVAQKTGQKVAG